MNLPGHTKPRTFHRSAPEGPHDINLTARDRKWSKFAYQFAHEFCHVISGYEDLKDNPNNWFHESICELASIFTLLHMGDSWRTRPPYANWAEYADRLKDYANDVIERAGANAPSESEFPNWLSSHEDELRNDRELRDKNAVVACRLLPLFEECPHSWCAVTRLPNTRSRIAAYLTAWWSAVDSADRPFVERVKARLTGA